MKIQNVHVFDCCGKQIEKMSPESIREILEHKVFSTKIRKFMFDVSDKNLVEYFSKQCETLGFEFTSTETNLKEKNMFLMSDGLETICVIDYKIIPFKVHAGFIFPNQIEESLKEIHWKN